MQPHDSNDQRPAQEPIDGRRDTERITDDSATGLAPAPIPDVADGTVCLSAKLIGSGKAAG